MIYLLWYGKLSLCDDNFRQVRIVEVKRLLPFSGDSASRAEMQSIA